MCLIKKRVDYRAKALEIGRSTASRKLRRVFWSEGRNRPGLAILYISCVVNSGVLDSN